MAQEWLKKTLSPRNEKFLCMLKNPDVYTFNLDAIRDPECEVPQSEEER